MLAAPDRPTSRGWYLVAFGLLGIALAIGWTGWNQMREVVETLQREAMPGSAEVALAGGRATIYYEHESTLGGRDYSTPRELELRCSLASIDGSPHTLKPATAQVTYSVGPYAGRALYDIDVIAPGSYTLTCSGPQPFVMTAGGGIGAWRVVAIVGGSAPGIAGLVVIVIVTLRRRRWFARNPDAPREPPATG